MLRCKGRIIVEHPVYLPRNHRFSSLVVSDAHERTLHGGVGLTMAKIRQKWWIEKLRSLVKSVLHKCNTCVKYRARPLPTPTQAPLPEFRTTGSRAFETVRRARLRGPDFIQDQEGSSREMLRGIVHLCYISSCTP